MPRAHPSNYAGLSENADKFSRDSTRYVWLKPEDDLHVPEEPRGETQPEDLINRGIGENDALLRDLLAFVDKSFASLSKK